MSKLDITIETDREGNHVVVFPGRREELIPPRYYDERLSWIKASFDRFIASVHDLNLLRRTAAIHL